MTNIIAITGPMFSGKTTASGLMQNILRYAEVSTQNIKFAQPLYDIQTAIYDIVGLEIPYPKDRELLQWIGADWGRKKDENLWVNAWKKAANKSLERGVQLVINDDLRYDNEAEVIKSVGGRIIRIEATDAARSARGQIINSGHSSERGISDKYIDAGLANSGSLLDLETQIEELLMVWEIL